jgi:thiosulfate dehydrogenase
MKLLALAPLAAVAALAAGGCATPEEPLGDTSSAARPAPTVDAPAPIEIAPPPFDAASRPYALHGPLIPADVTMVSAWDIPRNPLTDPALDGTDHGVQVRLGYRLFVNTPVEASRLTPSGMSCGNCHLNAGQRELALPLVGSAAMFPEYNGRAGRDFTLEDRIVGCFMRSENSSGPGTTAVVPDPTSAEVLALAAYIRWLSEGFAPGENPPWRKQNLIPQDKLIPIDQLDPQAGEKLFVEHCSTCHGEDGQGVQIADKKAGPLWGDNSWNDGAGAARVYTLAGIIRHMMPYLDPGVLTDEEAQHVAAFITSQPRPVYPHKDEDYQTRPRPIDAVYYDPAP